MIQEVVEPDLEVTEEVELSLVVPCYNEIGNLRAFSEAAAEMLDQLDVRAEILFVDDGSRDKSFELLSDFARRDSRIRVLRFARNHGKEIAISAGLDFARGKAVVVIDADLQHPPSLIPALLMKWREGYDVVIAERAAESSTSPARRWLSTAFYRLFNAMSDMPINPAAGDFRLLDRRAVTALKALPERTRFMKGLYGLAGLRQTSVCFDVSARAEGQSQFSLVKLWRFALDGLTSFSSLPLRFWSYLGAALVVPSGLYAAWIIVKTLVWGVDTPGFATLAILVLFLGGMQLVSLGILGEYVSRVFTEVKRRPLYVVSETVGVTMSSPTELPHGGLVLPPRELKS